MIETTVDATAVLSSPDAPLTCMSSEIDGFYYGYVAVFVFRSVKEDW